MCAISLIFIFENIYPSGNFRRKNNSFKRLHVLEPKRILWLLMLRSMTSIAPAVNLKKQQEKRITLQIFLVLFTRPVSSSGIYGTLLLPLMLLRTTAKKKILFACIHVYSCGIACFTEHRTALTHAESAILQSRDFILPVERTLKITYLRS